MNKHLEQQLTKLAWLENFIEFQSKPQTQRLMERLARKPITRAAGLSGEGAPLPGEAPQVVVVEDNKEAEKKNRKETFHVSLLKLAHAAMHKYAASLQAQNNKTYLQMLTRLFGGKGKLLEAAKADRANIGLFHGTRSADNLPSIFKDGLRPGPGSYGTGAYIGDYAKAQGYRSSFLDGTDGPLLKMKSPTEVTREGHRYPHIHNVNVTSHKHPELLLDGNHHVLHEAQTGFFTNVQKDKHMYALDRMADKRLSRLTPREYRHMLQEVKAKRGVGIRGLLADGKQQYREFLRNPQAQQERLEALRALDPGLADTAERHMGKAIDDIRRLGVNHMTRKSLVGADLVGKAQERYVDMHIRRNMMGPKLPYAAHRKAQALGIIGDQRVTGWQKRVNEMHVTSGVPGHLLKQIE